MMPDQQDSPDATIADRPVVEGEDSGAADAGSEAIDGSAELIDASEPIDPNARSYARDVLPILEEHCTECHHEGRQPDFTALPADRALREVIADRILARAVNAMPPSPREAIGAQDLMIIEAWKRDGVQP